MKFERNGKEERIPSLLAYFFFISSFPLQFIDINHLSFARYHHSVNETEATKQLLSIIHFNMQYAFESMYMFARIRLFACAV